MSAISDAYSWLTTADHWRGTNGVPVRLAEHLRYSGIALVCAVAIALPIGLFVGHTGRGRFLAVNGVNALRAVPTFGLLVLVHRLKPLALWPVEIALVALAVPPVVANTSAAIQSLDPGVRDSSRGMGMTRWQQLRSVEMPLAAPLILAGIRSACAQIIATVPIAALVSLGGFGRYIIDGYAFRDYGMIVAGAGLIAALALSAECLFALLQRVATPVGTKPQSARSGSRVLADPLATKE